MPVPWLPHLQEEQLEQHAVLRPRKSRAENCCCKLPVPRMRSLQEIRPQPNVLLHEWQISRNLKESLGLKAEGLG